MVLFKQRFHAGIIDGAVNLTFRRWSSPRVKIGGRYRLDPEGVVVINSVDEVALETVTEDQARLSGFSDLRELAAEINRGSSEPLKGDDTVYRVSFHYYREPDPRRQLSCDAEISPEELDRLSMRLGRMDSRSRHGPWTEETLTLIARRPRVAASKLATDMGRDTSSFKANVRKLKNLGLTTSHEVGYELSPRGRAFLNHRDLA